MEAAGFCKTVIDKLHGVISNQLQS